VSGTACGGVTDATMSPTNFRYGVALTALLFASCAARRPAFVVVPRATGRSEEPVTLPLDSAGRSRLEQFLSTVDRGRVLDALENADSLAVMANPSARRFCEFAEKLCAAAPLFRGRPVVRQVIDARESRRPVPAPLAVRDGPYWWIFRLRGGRLTAVLLVRDIRREMER
jgi:hypothetical protein